jgi:hypothetical protein
MTTSTVVADAAQEPHGMQERIITAIVEKKRCFIAAKGAT